MKQSGTFYVQRSGLFSKSLMAMACMAFLISPATVQQAGAQSSGVGKTGLPIPRFVSLKSGKANMRVGPGSRFQVDWQYVKKGLPIEIIQEFDNWRKVRDAEGNEGWMLHSLLSGKRTAIIKPWEDNKEEGHANLKSDSDPASSTIAKVEPGVVANVDYCNDKWCHLTVGETDGYISKADIWGVYPDEVIEE